MRSTIFLALSFAARIFAQGQPSTGGTGPYTAYYFEDKTLPNHTIYQPQDPSKVGTKLPVIAWANGACSQEGASFSSFLLEVTSHGAVAIAVGTIAKGLPTNGEHPERQRAAIDWAVQNAGKGNYTHLDASRIAVWGQSCGGLESYGNWNDTRVSSIGIYNSGFLSAADTNSTAGKITKPIFYFLGGSKDIAYANGERDYDALPTGTPTWLGNDKNGHGGAFNLPNAGGFGIAGTRYMQWLLRGNVTAGKWFQDGSAIKDGFVDEKSKSLDKINVTPIY